jgi:ParB family chromosome partitioning protein
MQESQLYSESIFFIDVNKINPNPYQPRREFDEARLRDLADSIRQYGVLQPLVVTRIEKEKPDGGIVVEYELIAGERRLRASRLAGLSQVPAVIRKDQNPMMKLELAIIENLQREDLNAVDRARSFLRLSSEFNLSHKEIGKKVGKSREYVSNSLRLLQMPQDILDALGQGKISEGHTRPLLMLTDRPEEQSVLFKEIVYKKITVREAERIAREIATDRARRKDTLPNPEIEEIQNKLQEALGTRVLINRKEQGGKITIDFFSEEDLRTIFEAIQSKEPLGKNRLLQNHMEKNGLEETAPSAPNSPAENKVTESLNEIRENENVEITEENSEKVDVGALGLSEEEIALLDDRSKDEIVKSEEDADLYNISKFSL